MVISRGIYMKARFPTFSSRISLFVLWCEVWLLAAGAVWFWRLYPLQAQSVTDLDHNRIEIRFNQPIVPFLASQIFHISPFVRGNIRWENGMRTLIFTSDGFQRDMVYDVSIRNARAWAGASIGEYKMSFFYEDAEPPLIDVAPVALPDPKTKRVFRASKVDWAVLSDPVYREGKYIDVDTAQQLLVMYEGGSAVSAFEISSGKRGYDTPAGTFRVLSKHDNHWSATYGLWMPYSLNFYGGYFIHELPYWPSGYREGEAHLGTRVSHGCIRLGIGAAKAVYDFADVGTVVYVH